MLQLFFLYLFLLVYCLFIICLDIFLCVLYLTCLKILKYSLCHETRRFCPMCVFSFLSDLPPLPSPSPSLHLVTERIHSPFQPKQSPSNINHGCHNHGFVLYVLMVCGESRNRRPYSHCQSLKPSLVFLNRASYGRRRNNDVTSQERKVTMMLRHNLRTDAQICGKSASQVSLFVRHRLLSRIRHCNRW